MKRRITVIVSQTSDVARMEELRAAITALRSAGHQVRVRVTFEAGDARRFARAAALRGCDVVVAAGGDGTVNEVVNGLVAADVDASLAVVPLGTANDFARGLELPADPAAALQVAVDGEAVAVDVARVNRRCFINVSTGGFGADATRSASRVTKRRLGALAYLMHGARRLMNFEPAHARFRADGELLYEGPFIFFAVGNARWTGGGTRVTPRADPGDGKLDVVVVTGSSRLDFLRLMPDLRAGTHLESPDVRYLRASVFEIASAERIPVNADGEMVAGRRFRYSLDEVTIPVMVCREQPTNGNP